MQGQSCGERIAAHGTGTNSLAFFASRSQIWRKLLRATRNSELASGDKPVSVSEIPTYTDRLDRSSIEFADVQKFLPQLDRRGSFMLSTATVARPVGVRPIISAPMSSKCSHQVCFRGLRSSTLLFSLDVNSAEI